jgi:hypothetical protein
VGLMSTTRDEIPLRTCPHCGEESRTRFERCPSCGKSLYDEPPRFSRTTKIVAGVAIALVVVVVGAIVVSGLAGQEHSKDKRVAAERAKLVASERRRLIREQAPRHGRPPGLAKPPATATDAEKIAARVALVRSMESDIATDARARVRTGELRGPIRYAKCGALSPTAAVANEERDLTRSLGRYDCVAVIRDVVDNGKVVGRYGHSFVGTVDFDRWRYVWCRNNPAPGERGKALVFVRLSRECLGAEGAPAVGTGYVMPGDGRQSTP